MIRVSLLLMGLLLAGCGTDEDTDTPVFGLIEGPSLGHEQPQEELISGQPLVLSVTATDPDGVSAVQAQYRTEGDLVSGRART